MSHKLENAATLVDVTDTEASHPAVTPASVKDHGRVKFGGASVHFSSALSTKDTGRVRFGGASTNY